MRSVLALKIKKIRLIQTYIKSVDSETKAGRIGESPQSGDAAK